MVNTKHIHEFIVHGIATTFCCVETEIECECYILTLDRAVNQRCTCVNKRKKKQKQVGLMKEYRQMLAAVESVGDRKARLKTSLQTKNAPMRAVVLCDLRLSNPS